MKYYFLHECTQLYASKLVYVASNYEKGALEDITIEGIKAVPFCTLLTNYYHPAIRIYIVDVDKKLNATCSLCSFKL